MGTTISTVAPDLSVGQDTLAQAVTQQLTQQVNPEPAAEEEPTLASTLKEEWAMAETPATPEKDPEHEAESPEEEPESPEEKALREKLEKRAADKRAMEEEMRKYIEDNPEMQLWGHSPRPDENASKSGTLRLDASLRSNKSFTPSVGGKSLGKSLRSSSEMQPMEGQEEPDSPLKDEDPDARSEPQAPLTMEEEMRLFKEAGFMADIAAEVEAKENSSRHTPGGISAARRKKKDQMRADEEKRKRQQQREANQQYADAEAHRRKMKQMEQGSWRIGGDRDALDAQLEHGSRPRSGARRAPEGMASPGSMSDLGLPAAGAASSRSFPAAGSRIVARSDFHK